MGIFQKHSSWMLAFEILAQNYFEIDLVFFFKKQFLFSSLLQDLVHNLVIMRTWFLLLVAFLGFSKDAHAFKLPMAFRSMMSNEQMSNPSSFMDPAFSVRSQSNSRSTGGSAGANVMDPPQGSMTGNDAAFSSQGSDTSSNSANYQQQQQPTNLNRGLQQSVNGNSMFNPGNSNSNLLAPPGTGNSQFNNNMGSKDSMLNLFGGNGVSVDASTFFRPKMNADGSLSGAAGNENGPPTMGPALASILANGGYNSNNNANNNNNNNNYNSANSGNNNADSNYNNMFAPPSFFMNPGSSFN